MLHPFRKKKIMKQHACISNCCVDGWETKMLFFVFSAVLVARVGEGKTC